MAETPKELKYLDTHEWARDESDGSATVGITDHAQDSLGDVVYVELPELGSTINAGEETGVVESVKAASDIFAPVSGEVIAVNAALEDEPETINGSPYGDGWFYKVKMSDPTELEQLLDAEGYLAAVESED